MQDIAIVDGLRTPFVKSFGLLADVRADELGWRTTVALLKRVGVSPEQIDQTVFGNVVMPAEATNIARVIALRAGIPEDRSAHTVQRNCASGMEAITTAAQLIQLGEAERVVAGGVESMSQVPLLFNREATQHFFRLSKAKTPWQRMRTMLGFRPRHFRPVPALKLGLTDAVCGMIMGETAELLVKDFGISREEQDRFALESHQRAVAAQQRGLFQDEITPLVPEGLAASIGRTISEDIGPRKDQSLEALAKLPPYFKKDGTVTVGNSCQVTDGAAAVLVMPAELAQAEGRQPLGYLKAFAYAGCDPRRMGLGPIHATNKLLKKTGWSLKDIELIEINEAFAAQVIANLRAFPSSEFARQHLDRPNALGEIAPARLNVNGGAIALGHPVGATGARLVITLLNEMRRRNLHLGLATLCVGGGQGAALLLERR
jgi:acetyl-CoA C-acetyltransferase/acetyl-CoA acyltransferase